MVFQIAKTTDEFTPSDVADPTPLPDIRPYDVLIRPVPPREKSAGGIIIHDSLKSDIAMLTQIGRVIRLGSKAFKNSDRCLDVEIKEGDYVIFDKFNHEKMRYKGVLLALCVDETIKMKVGSPSDLDPNVRDF